MEDFPVEGSPVEGHPAENPLAEGSPVDGSPKGRRPDPRITTPVDPFTDEPAYEISRRHGVGRAAGGGTGREARRGVESRSSGRWRTVALGLGLILAILAGATGSLLYSALTRSPGSSTGSANTGANTTSPSSIPHASDASGPTPTPGGSVASPDISTSPGHSA